MNYVENEYNSGNVNANGDVIRGAMGRISHEIESSRGQDSIGTVDHQWDEVLRQTASLRRIEQIARQASEMLTKLNT